MAHNAMGRLVLRAPNSLRQSISVTQKRSWSARTVPSLFQTSSPELNEKLNRFRDELFIPQSLNKQQQHLIYKRFNAEKLNEQSIVLSIGEKEEPYRLRYLDPSRTPNKTDSKKVLKLMAQTKEWSNLVLFLTGIHNSGQSLKQRHWEWLTRQAGANNGLGVLLECARQAKSTRFTLNNTPIVERLFWELHLAGQRCEFMGQPLAKAEGLARQFVLLMEAPEHSGRITGTDNRKHPLVIGTLLELNAASALSSDSNPKSVEVETGAKRLLAALENHEFVLNEQKWVTNDLTLQKIVPVYNGIGLSLKVDHIAKNGELASKLREAMGKLGSLIAQMKEKAQDQGVNPEKPSIGLSQAQLLHQN